MKKNSKLCIFILLFVMLFSIFSTTSAQEFSYLVYEQQPGIAKKGALDYSWLNDAPAGTHGHVIQDGDDLKFEDGTPVKFFGVVLGFGAATPEKEVAQAYANELASSGINFARIHAIDCTYNGILTYSDTEKTTFHEENLDKMDYLIYCLKQKGIYVHLDTNAGRVLTAADGFTPEEVAAGSSGALRATRFFYDKVIKVEQDFIVNLLSHTNPYTGMTYATDPVIAVIQYANESSITWYDTANVNNVFTDDLNKQYNAWLLNKYKTRDALQEAWTMSNGRNALRGEDPTDCSVSSSSLGVWGEPLITYRLPYRDIDCSPRHADFTSFLIEKASRTFTSAYEKIRSLGYKSLINCSNYPERAADLYINSLGDVMERNSYWNHPKDNYTVPATFHSFEMASTDPRNVENQDVFSTHSVGIVSRASVADKPLIVTEWNVTTPSDFKADSILQMAAYGAFQGWDGFCVFNYTFSGDSSFFSLNGYTDFFTCCIDPSTYAQIGLAAMIFRTGIVSEAENSVEVVLTKDDVLSQNPDFTKGPQYLSFVSKFSYRFIDNIYNGNADIVIPSGNTASGDYTNAKHLLMYTENIYSDAYNKIEGRTDWYNKHLQPQSDEVMIGTNKFRIGPSAAIADNEENINGGFYSGQTDLDTTYTEVMRRFGLLDDEEGYFDDKVVTDTKEITYTYNTNFKLETERAAIFAGKTNNNTNENIFGSCKLITDNDRAAVAVVSTDGSKSIQDATKINIYAMGRSTNTGLTWEYKNNTEARLTSLGDGPILFEDIRGTLQIPTKATECSVYGLDSLGNRVRQINTKAVDDGFSISLGGFANYEVLLTHITSPEESETQPSKPDNSIINSNDVSPDQSENPNTSDNNFSFHVITIVTVAIVLLFIKKRMMSRATSNKTRN